MRDWVKRALTRKVARNGRRGKEQITVIPPSQRLLYAVYFSLGMVGCLTVLEAAHLMFWASGMQEIFTVVAGLMGNITGIFLTQKT